MQTDRRKTNIKESFKAIDMALSFFARMIIAIVVLYILGKNLTSPTNLQIFIIDTCILWWIISPLIKYAISGVSYDK